MMHMILGTAGTGKTAMLYEKIKSRVESGEKAIVIVPEQASFETEKALYRKLGAKNSLLVETLSFTRLCDRVFRELGGLSGVHLDEPAKYLLMSVALEELGGALLAYGRSAKSAAFASDMCGTISELKTAGATPGLLRQAANAASGGFADKLSDIALIFDAYEAMIERGYSDPDDSLRRACKRVNGSDFFGGYHVFIDGFMAFMGAEWGMIEQLFTRCPEVTVALTCENMRDNEPMGVFSAAGETARRLVETAKRCGARVAAPKVLGEPHRFKNPALAYIASELPKSSPEPCGFEARDVHLTSCEDIYDELEYVAANISALVRDEGFRYNEIAVIARDLGSYLVPVQTVFSRYNLPFFTDLRADIHVHPLVSGLLCALDAARTGFDSEFIIPLAKKYITGVDAVDAGLLENYCFTWGVTGAAWTTDFVNNPDGMTGGFTEGQTGRLERINAVRRNIIPPLEKLRAEITGCDGRGFAASAFEWLERTNAVKNLQAAAEKMPPDRQKQLLETSAQVWDIIIGLFDVFGGALEGVRLKTARLIELFRMGLSSANIGNLPQTLDQIIIGTADRIRPQSPRAVFIIGVNEGLFPLWGGSAGIFSSDERDRLKQQGIDLLYTAERFTLFEKYFVYFALTQASERLWVSFPQRGAAGEGMRQSSVISQLGELVGVKLHSSESENPFERVAGERTAFDLMTRGWRDTSPHMSALKSFFAGSRPETMQRLAAASGTRSFHMDDRTVASRLFGETLRVSPSRVEQFYQCPFSFFCSAGMRLKPRRRVEFDPLESGSLIHLVLERMVKKYGGAGLATRSVSELREEAAEIIAAELKSKITDFDGMPERFKYMFARLVNTVARLLSRLALEFSVSRFEPAAFELPIGEGEAVKPLRLFSADGTPVIVEGKVDRVDTYTKDGKRYIRVVDYKSGRKAFSLADVCYGLNMQMLIYLFSVCENLPEGEAKACKSPLDGNAGACESPLDGNAGACESPLDGNAGACKSPLDGNAGACESPLDSNAGACKNIPAGVLYMPARDSIISTGRHASEEEVRDEQIGRLKMNGILLEDYESLSAMEPELSGIFIPVKTKKDGSFDSRSSLANLSQMGAISRQVGRRLTELADALHSGGIAAAPADGLSGYDPCGWCDYHSICTHEQEDEVRSLADMDREKAIEEIEEEDANDC